MPVRIPWDDYEIALMFEIYLEMASTGMTLSVAAEKLSKQLRQKAVNQGQVIDSVFRNTNGMVFYLKRTEYLFTKGKTGLSGAQKNVVAMYEVYCNDQAKYHQILRKAHELAGVSKNQEKQSLQVPDETLSLVHDDLTKTVSSLQKENIEMGANKTVEEVFFQWLAGRITSAQLSEIYQCFHQIDEFCIPRGILKKPAFQITTPSVLNRALGELERNKVFKRSYRSGITLSALRHYIRFTKENQEELQRITSHTNQDPLQTNIQSSEAKPVTVDPVSAHTLADTQEQEQQIDPPVDPNEAVCANTVDFNHAVDYAHSIPLGFSYFGDIYAMQNWQRIYVAILECFAEDYPERFKELTGKSVKGSDRVLIGTVDHAANMKKPKLITKANLYADCGYSANNLVKLIAMLLRYFSIDYENVVIKYKLIDNTETSSDDQIVATNKTDISDTSMPTNNTNVVQQGVSQLSQFRQWMIDNGYSATTSRVYAYSLSESARYAVEHGISPFLMDQVIDATVVEGYLAQLLADAVFIEKNKKRSNQLSAGVRKYIDFLLKCSHHMPAAVVPKVSVNPLAANIRAVDPQWKEILEKDFPDGYILNDFLSQFQAAAMWQERFGSECPIEGDAIDQAISACGTLKDGRVFVSNEKEGKLLSEIADVVTQTLQTYSNIYTSQVYKRYQEELASLSIFTEKVMVQQVMQHAAGRFNYTYSYLFTKPGDSTLTEVDCERALLKHGGMITTDEVAEELWFIPKDKVGHYLSVNNKILNLGSGQWMLAEHFPFGPEDAKQVAKMLDEQFLSQEYILSRDIPELLKQHLPFVAENVSGLTFTGLFNIINYYLQDRYSFTRSIVTPIGTRVDFVTLFTAYAAEHESFSVDELDMYAKEELGVPIYWESIYAGGAIRISSDTFVSRNQVGFDVKAIDMALEAICSSDYMSFMSVPKGMLMLLPACGHQWNHYLLQSFVYGYSKVFKMVYNSLGKSGCYGAMVRRNCSAINSYEQLVEKVLTDDNTWSTQTEALNLLVKHGYQAVRRLNGIEGMIARAKQNKMQ